MKKRYEKPQIVFEDFTMTTNIAGDCEAPYVGNATKGTCAVLGTGNIAIFSSDMTGICYFTPDGLGSEEDIWDGLCYHVPTEYNNLFNS